MFAATSSVTAKDLEGKTFAVGQLGGAAELIARSAIDAEGGDSSKVTFVEVAAEQMGASLKSGSIKAALLTEPFATQAELQGLFLMNRSTAVGGPGLPATTWVTTTKFGTENVGLLKRFVTAVQKAGKDANSDPISARAVAKTYMTAPPAVIDSIRFPVFSESVGDTSGIKAFVTLANKYSMLAKQPDLKKILAVKVTAGS